MLKTVLEKSVLATSGHVSYLFYFTVVTFHVNPLYTQKHGELVSLIAFGLLEV